ncbi:MAG: N-acyl homoserine lactonase family protein [Caulobacteraceae bacterium]|nr:N-acyl homoserine lactonase family protein [Caulobacteraceae bacterium]
MRLPALALAICAALAAAPAARAAGRPPDVRLYAIDCGRIATTDADGYADDGAYRGAARTLVVPCFLIRHPRGDLLWNTGLPAATAERPVVEGTETLTLQRPLADQLKRLRLKPADIEFLSVSHSHFDHMGSAGLFAGSTWIVDAKERAYAFRPQARAAGDFAAYAALETADTILIEGEGDHDVFGDGSVTIVQAPGHTPGHTVLLVRLRKAGPVLLAGDLWHFDENRQPRRVPRFNTDRAQTLASMDKVEALAAAAGARVVLEHVPWQFEALPKFPKALR